MIFQPAAPASCRSMTALGAAAATATAGLMLTATRLYALTRQLHRARHDPVTGLLTRAAWEPAAHAALRHRHGDVGVVDLDGFKSVNDRYGHAIGDEVLRTVATRLKNRLGCLAVVGRIGGDEMAFVTRRLSPGDLDALIDALTMPIPTTSAGVLQVGVSLGVSALGGQAGLTEALVAADQAMYQAKAAGHGGWRVRSPRAALPALCPAPRRELRAVTPATQEVNQR